jgi:hypothetical protein
VSIKQLLSALLSAVDHPQVTADPSDCNLR